MGERDTPPASNSHYFAAPLGHDLHQQKTRHAAESSGRSVQVCLLSRRRRHQPLLVLAHSLTTMVSCIRSSIAPNRSAAVLSDPSPLRSTRVRPAAATA
jgi:hypothetical protein